MIIESFKDRFSPDGECQIVALDFVFFFLNGYQVDKEKISCVKKLPSILNFLEKNNFSFIVSVPIFSILSPYYWILKLKYFKYVRIGNSYKNKKKKLQLQKINYSILIEESAKRIYGLEREYWTHFIVFYNDLKTENSGIYDPLRCILENEYNQKLNNFDQLSEIEIDFRSLLKILIWKK